MEVTHRLMEQLIFMRFQPTTRFTQDSPVYPDVWMEYFEHVDELDTYRADLILTPHKKSNSAELLKLISDKLNANGITDRGWEMAATGDSVVARLTFTELIRDALPLTNWWQTYLWHEGKPSAHQEWLKQLTGAMLYAGKPGKKENATMPVNKMLALFNSYFDKIFSVPKPTKNNEPIVLWSVSKNRAVSISIEKSIPATKADAGRRVFDIDGSEITWAVLDTGIDARHSAFRRIDPDTNKPFKSAMGSIKEKFSNQTRIVATYDFTIFRDVLAMIQSGSVRPGKEIKMVSGTNNDEAMTPVDVNNHIKEITRDLREGRFLDWSLIAPLLRIPHNVKEYKPPVHPHGTHVAGILGANLATLNDYKLVGMCPNIELYDIRVLNEEGSGEEFNILAAIQFLRWINNQKDGMMIHGANLSFSMFHEVASYACGMTPVCEACEKLVAEGTVVVAAAGNLGQTMFTSTKGLPEPGFRMVNITDPGNAEAVITVGATHRNRPHSYGVSYFSSKGPTGDGRSKPDLVAPGEKIVSTSIDESTERMDGSSMAAPHVSGAAALLMAKHRELIGRPLRIKEILCKTATDLGREKYFQGFGMIDVLRAIQSV